MGTADIVGIYGAVLSTILLVAQGVTYLQRRKLVQIHVEVRDMYSADNGLNPPPTIVLIRAVNTTDHPLRINGVYLEQKGKKGVLLPDGLPGVLPPHDSYEKPVPYDLLSRHFDFEKPLTAIVSLTNQTKFKKTVVLKSKQPLALAPDAASKVTTGLLY